MITFGRVITLILAAFSLKFSTRTYRDQIETEVKHEFLSRFFCVVGVDESCDAFGERIKSNLVDLLENQCSRCSLQMQAVGSIAIPYLKEEFPDLWTLLVKRCQEQEESIESYFFNAYNCLLQDLNCNSSLELLKRFMPILFKLKFIPGRADVTILLGQQLKILEKKQPFIYQQLLDKFNV